MTRYIALLRAVNVGGTNKLAMSALKAMCGEAGFARVETLIASGNVVFESDLSPGAVKAALESRLHAHLGKPVGVVLRSAAELEAVCRANPFAGAEPRYTYVLFLEAPPPAYALAHVTGRGHEELRLGHREIFIHYPGGMGRSKLKIPAARTGTARNMSTVAKLAAIAAKP